MALLLYEGGGGIEAWLKCGMEADDGDGRGCGVDSNFTGGSDMSDAIEGCEFAGTIGLVDEPFGSRMLVLLSELYMTATFVDGEFIVPVRDHPMAAPNVSVCNYFTRKEDRLIARLTSTKERGTDLDWC